MLRLITLGGLFLGLFVDARAQITSSFTIIDYWVGKLLTEPGAIHQSIIPSGGELHGYQLTPSDSLKLSKSRVIIGLNPHSETWLNDWIKANNRSASIIWINEKFSQVSHPWMSPAVSKAMVKTLHDGLMIRKLSSEVNLNQVLAEIRNAELSVVREFATVPESRRIIITQHPNLLAFAEAFNLEVAGSIIESPEAESADPSAQKYSQLLKLIKARNIRVITCDAGQNNRVAQQLAKDAKINPPLPLTVEYLEKSGTPGDTWPSMILTNAQKISEALKK
ncbi:MAG: metal ABC transporter substrate-binding protein [Opitutales bacterium]|jgi:ABC-type Zn uptake system ZnuABC Zn-binding protein ZnuA|nr:metal ABC transporter substrate-binding protein [Opitutales bacterium]